MTERSEVTRLLQAANSGQEPDVDLLLPLLYDQLQSMARKVLRNEMRQPTLATIDLVHEAYLRLVDQSRVTWQGRGHFMAVAAMAMRRVVVDRARHRNRAKRGGGVPPLTLKAELNVAAENRNGELSAEDIIMLDATLDRLAEFDPRGAKVVECRYFAGLSIEETAQALDCSPITVKRAWRGARSWLRREMDSTS
ncbi:MAG: sigma-70 family RNA polymerase sigma factor [bacterium]|nr:sigma-70 family RNA polymerase sigma factor [bacterium]